MRTGEVSKEREMFIDSGNIILNSEPSGYTVAEKKELVGTEDMDEMQKKVVEFFKENPDADPENGDIYNWSDFGKVAPQAVDVAVYELMAMFVEFLANGRANKEGVTEDDVDSEELRMGIEVEYEHTTDEETAKRIALDHLAELPDYYTRLKKMEDEGKAAKEGNEEVEIDISAVEEAVEQD